MFFFDPISVALLSKCPTKWTILWACVSKCTHIGSVASWANRIHHRVDVFAGICGVLEEMKKEKTMSFSPNFWSWNIKTCNDNHKHIFKWNVGYWRTWNWVCAIMLAWGQIKATHLLDWAWWEFLEDPLPLADPGRAMERDRNSSYHRFIFYTKAFNRPSYP